MAKLNDTTVEGNLNVSGTLYIGGGDMVNTYPGIRWVTETWHNDTYTDWYTIYNDGWKECGGMATGVAYNTETYITLPIERVGGFTNTNYTITGSVVNTSTGNYSQSVYFMISSGTKVKMVTSFNGGSASTFPVRYYCCGY